MTEDLFKTHARGLDGPAEAAFAIIPDQDFALVCRGIYVGVGGDLVLRMRDADQNLQNITYLAVPQGTLLPVRCERVVAAGTSAAGLVGLI